MLFAKTIVAAMAIIRQTTIFHFLLIPFELQQLIAPGRQQGCLSVSSFKFLPQAIAVIAEKSRLSDKSDIFA